mmetsp:Transcript_97479/g.257562  ORF Transcript_97479/g.257562 Transcript_97479/m.257562 type:complete len:317 (-) Transcript_97479:360-1310(-)
MWCMTTRWRPSSLCDRWGRRLVVVQLDMRCFLLNAQQHCAVVVAFGRPNLTPEGPSGASVRRPTVAALQNRNTRVAHRGAGVLAAAAALACLAGHPLHGFLNEALHAIEAVILVEACASLLGPLRAGSGRTSEALDHVYRGDVQGGLLPNLHAAGQADVSLAELDTVLKPQGAAEALPAPCRHGRHRLDYDLAAVQAGEAEHVLVGGLVGTIQLSDEEVQQEDDGGDDVDDDGYHQGWGIHQLVVARAVDHAEGDPEELLRRLVDACEVRVSLLQGGDRTCECCHDEANPDEEEEDLVDDAAADQCEGRNSGRYHG